MEAKHKDTKVDQLQVDGPSFSFVKGLKKKKMFSWCAFMFSGGDILRTAYCPPRAKALTGYSQRFLTSPLQCTVSSVQPVRFQIWNCTPQGEPPSIPQKRSYDQRAHPACLWSMSKVSQLKGTRAANRHTVAICILGVLDFIMRQFGHLKLFIAGGRTSLLTLGAMQITVPQASWISGTNVEC